VEIPDVSGRDVRHWPPGQNIFGPSWPLALRLWHWARNCGICLCDTLFSPTVICKFLCTSQ